MQKIKVYFNPTYGAPEENGYLIKIISNGNTNKINYIIVDMTGEVHEVDDKRLINVNVNRW